MSEFISCDCPHSQDNHYLIRCGCPNDRAPTHPMYHMDDAFHRVWCSDCLAYCAQHPQCTSPLFTTLSATTNIPSPSGYPHTGTASAAPLNTAFFSISTLYSFLTLIFSTLRRCTRRIFFAGIRRFNS